MIANIPLQHMLIQEWSLAHIKGETKNTLIELLTKYEHS